jgi:UDP-N-acetylglucosamine--N-acetylmuramyl-(pentapeptide) pyrophosphoryl-undecaprenol N-acetylglucosamine transferase
VKRSRHGPAGTFALLTGGGTAGHVQPALAVAEALVARGYERSTIAYVGSRRGMEARLVPAAGFAITLLPGRGIKRRLSLDNLGALAGLVLACALAFVLVARRRPRVVVTVGGYAGLPCSLAAIALRVPLVVISYDAVPGAANRLVGRFARKCAVAFDSTGLANEVVTGAPVRTAVLAVDRSEAGRLAARNALGLASDRFCLLIAGGSLGARRINDAAAGLARSWAERGDITIYHVAGERNLADVGALTAGLAPAGPERDGLDYHLVGYEQKMPALLAACDLAVLRAGASTVAELCVIGTPSVLVPLPGAPHDHQTKNAEALFSKGAAVVLNDRDCTPERLGALVEELRAEPERLVFLAKAAAANGQRDAAEKIAALVDSVAKRSR